MKSDTQLLTVNQVCEKLAISRLTLWRRRNDDTNFPQPIYLGSRALRFRLADVEVYIETLAAKGDRR